MNTAALQHTATLHRDAEGMLGILSDKVIASVYGHSPFSVMSRRLRLGIPTFQQWEIGIRAVHLPALVRGTISAQSAKRRSARQARQQSC